MTPHYIKDNVLIQADWLAFCNVIHSWRRAPVVAAVMALAMCLALAVFAFLINHFSSPAVSWAGSNQAVFYLLGWAGGLLAGFRTSQLCSEQRRTAARGWLAGASFRRSQISAWVSARFTIYIAGWLILFVAVLLVLEFELIRVGIMAGLFIAGVLGSFTLGRFLRYAKGRINGRSTIQNVGTGNPLSGSATIRDFSIPARNLWASIAL